MNQKLEDTSDEDRSLKFPQSTAERKAYAKKLIGAARKKRLADEARARVGKFDDVYFLGMAELEEKQGVVQ